MSTVRVGVIGAGTVGTDHVETLATATVSTEAKASAASPLANRVAASMNTVRLGGVPALRSATSAEEATPVGLARERIGRPTDDGGGFTRSGGKRGGGGVGLAV